MSDTIGFVMLCNSWTSVGARESLNVCVRVSGEVFIHVCVCNGACWEVGGHAG